MQKCKSSKMLIFLNLQTTGLESADRICSIGIIGVESNKCISKYDLINDGKKISSKASSINNITNEMLKDRAKFQETDVYRFLQEHNNKNSTLIAHNIGFTLKMLLQSGFNWSGEIIDTQRVTKHLIPECGEFSLQFLRYELKLYRDEKELAIKSGVNDELFQRGALNNSLYIKLLYNYLLEIEPHINLIELSSKNVLINRFEFGKYSGCYIEEISISDRGYLVWMLESIESLDDDLRYSIKNYLS